MAYTNAQPTIEAQPVQAQVVQAQPVQTLNGMQPVQAQPTVQQPFTMQQMQQRMGMEGGDPEAPGPLYNPELRQAMALTGNWSDGLFDCFDDVNTCLMACCCGPCQVYRNIRRVGWVDMFGMTKINAIGYLAIAVVLCIITGTLSAIGLAPVASLAEIAAIIVGVGVILGFIKKFYIKEDLLITLAKSFCCGCCYLAQISRHVFRAMGYLPVNAKVMIAPAVAPPMAAMAQPMVQAQPMGPAQQQQPSGNPAFVH